MRWFLEEHAKTIGLGALALLALSAAGLAISEMVVDKEVTKSAIDVSEQIEEKMIQDIREMSTIELSDNFYVDLTGVYVNDGKGIVDNGEKSLDVYGLGTDRNAYKLTYDLTDEQVEALTKSYSITISRNERGIIKALEEIFKDLEISKLELNDMYAVTLGLTSEKDFKNFAKILGPAVETDKILKRRDYNSAADAFLPIYSNIERKEIDGEEVAIMTVEGLELHAKNNKDWVGGFLVGMLASDYFDSPVAGYALGVTFAYANATKYNDVYTRKEEIMIKLTEQQKEMDNEQLRTEIMSALTRDTQKYVKNTVFLSQKVNSSHNKIYSKIVELGKGK